MKILGIIPARGGSKGVPNKNRKLLAGKPLLAYTITAAQESSLLETLIFSSEDDTLITLAKDFNVSVPFIRPAELASDSAGSLAVVQHAVRFMQAQGHFFDAVCLLQVTTPFRAKGMIDKAILKFKETNADTLISVQKVPHQYNPHWIFEASGNTLKIATGEKKIIKRRQELPDAFIRDGAIYITKTKVLMEQHSFFGSTIAHIETAPSLFVNIDTDSDWEKAEQIIRDSNN